MELSRHPIGRHVDYRPLQGHPRSGVFAAAVEISVEEDRPPEESDLQLFRCVMPDGHAKVLEGDATDFVVVDD
jgi:hypothetical protein